MTEDYVAFVKKFARKKTSDDTFTPADVYQVVLDHVVEKYHLGNRPIVRPFWPDENYELFDYPKQCVVVDNPPFSILSKIIKFFDARGIDYYLFGPHLTIGLGGNKACYCITAITLRYENGANVNTSFATSLDRENRFVVDLELANKLKAVQKKHPITKKKKITLPPDVVTTSRLGRLINHGYELVIRKDECKDECTVDGYKVFGRAWRLNEAATARYQKIMKSIADDEKSST